MADRDHVPTSMKWLHSVVDNKSSHGFVPQLQYIAVQTKHETNRPCHAPHITQFYSQMLFTVNEIFCWLNVIHNWSALWILQSYQSISSHIAEYVFMHFHRFMGEFRHCYNGSVNFYFDIWHTLHTFGCMPLCISILWMWLSRVDL